ncbi:lysophospholipid acyltransferase family protein [Paracoccus shanxieyensis]|uniref:1-acyl-sn-glycerol-3-phosphate acyltransferase n=1 Tax=Paracoccus shanxieyensis TaxID=2675752 RepID=A0A6L6IUN1_9RHOB|nr:lysophospholipid acyltransferase family protein [Paracoccus shanxieyensis]MTH63328.1 1-acyl-sn-glycerol-3-phosphate acyltransferase [Paracoccus shanxieyensis]MTH87242.1 1-acyl-sn-glycerol-3-phosphate acyltransferase [Paracoccus shanxieyensis]
MSASYRPGSAGALAWLRTGIYYLYIALATLVLGLWGLPRTLLNPDHANRVASVWLGQMMGAARIIMGVKVEFRGTPPAGDLLIAAKHQSFLDILAIAQACPRRAFVMKRAVLNVPIMGWFARKVGCIPIDRMRGKDAIRQITAEVTAARARPQGLGQLIFYPEGTRTLPGTTAPYKPGVTIVQRVTGLPIVPVAANCGMFWPKRGFPIRPGTAVVEFLPPIPAGGDAAGALVQLEQVIEPASMTLFLQAGGSVPAPATVLPG